jgi:hypothetical protein
MLFLNLYKMKKIKYFWREGISHANFNDQMRFLIALREGYVADEVNKITKIDNEEFIHITTNQGIIIMLKLTYFT